MRYKIICFLLLFIPVFLSAQLKIGFKAGLNFANVINASSINSSSRTGYMIGGYIAPKPKKSFGYRTELILSRQGYNYKTNTLSEQNMLIQDLTLEQFNHIFHLDNVSKIEDDVDC